MPEHTPARRRCPDCDGFPVVHVTTGTHHRDGSRCTTPVICPACRGTGRVPASAYAHYVGEQAAAQLRGRAVAA